MDRTQKTFVKRSYDHVCARCGKDISYRSKSALYCDECAHILNVNRTKERKKNYDRLTKRDTPAYPAMIMTRFGPDTDKKHTYVVCPACMATLNGSDKFCRCCGQRIGKISEQQISMEGYDGK